MPAHRLRRFLKYKHQVLNLHKNLLVIGKVLKPHGTGGKVKVFPYTDSPETYQEADILYMKGANGTLTPLHVSSIASLKGKVILGADEIASMEKAEEARGCEILIDKDRLNKLPDGEYYQYELIGLDVVTVAGENLGKIEEILPTGSNDVFVVRSGEKEHLIPALKDVIKEIDFERRKMLIEPFDGIIRQDEV